MGWFSTLIGGNATQPIEAIGNVFDQLFTSDEERAKGQAILAKIAQKPQILQAEINKIEASHRSVFVAGWRPFIGWVCGFNLLYLTFLRDIIVWAMTIMAPELPQPPAVGLDLTVELIVALLGLGALRTFEKVKGNTK